LPPRIDRVYVSDFDLALDHVVASFGIYHILCLHHLSRNITKNLAPALGVLLQPFLTRFWHAYYSVSPAAFDVRWAALLTDFPRSRDYLEKVLEPTKERWAWAWTVTRFTCGVRTSGRVESENRVNKMFGNTKSSLFSLVKNLIERSDEQVEQEQLIGVPPSFLYHRIGSSYMAIYSSDSCTVLPLLPLSLNSLHRSSDPKLQFYVITYRSTSSPYVHSEPPSALRLPF
jgi:hypothetical protein